MQLSIFTTSKKYGINIIDKFTKQEKGRILMKMVLASQNRHKAQEMQAILGDKITLVTLDEAGFGDLEIIEDGDTFEANAIKKAVTVMEVTGLPCISDDSGLCVDALDGAPGIYTARFAGENATDDENISKLLSKLDGVETEKRTAQFVCVIAVARPGKETITFRGECPGKILTEKRGQGGFGYDPVFYVEEYGKAMAELAPEIKNSISHRSRALAKLNIED